MRALPLILKRRPRAHVLIVGGDQVSYGPHLPPGETHRKRLLAEVGARLDPERIHFLGRLPYPDYVNLLRISSAHVYLTYPFVLSWSMLEAMSAGCLVIGSKTGPVEEVIQHGHNGLLVDFFSLQQIADAVDQVLDHPDRMQAVREQARATIVDRYDLTTRCLPRQHALIADLIAGKRLAVDVDDGLAMPA
jgi:glycosyltransferase involved in cell wall biosynthesis